MIKLKVFIFAAFLSANAFGETGETVSTSELSPRFYDAGVELESGGNWRNSEARGMDHEATLVLGWSPIRDFRAGLESSAVLAREANGGGPGDTEITLARKGLSLGSFGAIDFGSLTILPTDRAERNSGLQVAQGALLGWELEAFSGLTIGYEAKASRFFRNPEKAATPLEDESLTAATFDKTRLEQKLGFSYEMMRGLKLETSGKHTSGWKWFGGRDAALEIEQKVAYEIGQWSIGLGHRNETLLLAPNGERKTMAFYRPQDSKLFGTLAWAL